MSIGVDVSGSSVREHRAGDPEEFHDFVATKRAMPRPPPGFVARPRLFDLLDDRVDDAALTLIRAPAGTGKTALVSAWAAGGRAPGPVAWLSLASGDDTRSRFWRQVALALVEAVDDDSFRIAFSSTAGIDALLSATIEALATRERPVVLVLDDVHELRDPEVVADLDRMLRAPPAGLRIIATARWDLPLHVSRLRLTGALAQIGETDLAFTYEEGLALFRAAGLDLDDADARRIWERTEGWVAGLALTALALPHQADRRAFVDELSGGLALVADYLLEEVLADESPQVREFLVMTAILDEVCGDLADAMTGHRGGGAVLVDLHQRGVLTTALDDHHEWFRYHGLLAGMLRSVLRRERPDLPRVLHARAARWLVANGRVVPGARHAAAAQDVELLADICAEHAFALSARGELGELGAVIATLPEADLTVPTLLLTLAGAAMEVGDAAAAADWLERVDHSEHAIPEHRRPAFELGRALARLYEARLTGNVDGALEAARPLLQPSGRARARLDRPEVEAVVLIHLGALELGTGDLPAAERHLDAGVAASETAGQGFLTVYGLALRSIVSSWNEDAEGAEHAAGRALEIADRHGWRASPRAGVALTVLGHLAADEGDVVRAAKLQDEADAALVTGLELPLRGQASLPRARLARLRGRPQEALAVIAEARVALAGTPFLSPLEPYLLEQEALSLRDVGEPDRAIGLLQEALGVHGAGGQVPMVLALLHVERGDGRRALALIEPWADPAAATRVNLRIGALLVRARAERGLGEGHDWRRTTEQALALAQHHRRRGPLLEHGPELQALLDDHRREGTAYGAFVASLRDGAVPRPALVAVAGTPPLLESLSDRELVVLRYLPTMLSNREIAGELIVSVNTVKTHVRSIYAKLGAHDRRAAVERARKLGLLSTV